ncbi:MAG: sulfite exporter TauE/SafE family protein [Proteobacteria bacterium]|nr:sulfite exporter TauE/SafE family protein [Pseudomonadota bacterium]
MDFGISGLALVAAVFVVAGFVKGVVGFGLPTISMGILGALIAPDMAAAILIVPTFLTNIWQAFVGKHTLAVLRRIWPMLAGVFLGTLATAGVITGADPRIAAALIGTMLVTYAALGLSGFRFHVPRKAEIFAGPVAGLTTGLINGATAIFVLPGAPYLQASELNKDELIQALGFVGLAAPGALALGFGLNRPVEIGLWPAILVALIAAIAGMTAGQAVRGRLTVSVFQRWVLIGLAVLGSAMLLRVLA